MSEQSGKISHEFFKESFLGKCGKKRPEVTAGPQFGVDVSIINLANGQAMAMASDPLSLIPSLGLSESARLSVNLVANDIATTGFAPMYGQIVLNLPAEFSKKDFQTYWDYFHQYCSKLGIAITGGHTGFIEGQNSTIAGGGTLVTIADQNQMLTSTLAEPGDAILVTKGCAISSVALLARSFPETVKNEAGAEHYHKACDLFYEISVLEEALLATSLDLEQGVTAMHDVTEGGVLGAIYELAVASANGAIVYKDQLPVSETQSRVCEVFSLDATECIGAGAMIITCKKEAVQKIISKLKEKDISCTEVGQITDQAKGIKLNTAGQASDLIYKEKDPYWEAFFKALNAGWK
ncbi:AIR synthase family protein [Psychroflexus sediminis]|uniref:Hydrogenase maturation factor n=1 Tax=Psychroflexus sediminis TaxID=470826 RepID=A0A1G7VY53_9FLAO|nr:AIR synthase family protein [Psychroflexus sediminis]SDG64705.1 Hydrogenase maturation factor [Psychroflexus sediminis]